MESTHSSSGLFVVADDLGLNRAVNEGIVFAFKKDLINGASLMANGEAFDDAISKIANLEAELPSIGIHLVLVEEKPLTQIRLPKSHKTFFFKYILGFIKKDEIEGELDAQIQKILGASIKPQFINSHQHLHLLPGIMDIVISLSKKYNIGQIRIINEPIQLGDKLFRKTQLIFLNLLSWMAKKKIRKAGLGCNDFFVGFINAGNLSLEDLKLANRLKRMHPEKVIELGCHPGFESQELVEKYSHWRYNWEKEIEVLKKKNNE